MYYRIGGGRYWKVFTDFQPKFILNDKDSVSSRENYLYFANEKEKYVAIAILSSSLFYWYFINTTNCRDLNPYDLQSFPLSFNRIESDIVKGLVSIAKKLMKDYQVNSEMKTKVSQKTGNIIYQEFYPRLSKSIINEIDTLIGTHYGLTQQEINFIINYDIKFRLGSNEDEE